MKKSLWKALLFSFLITIAGGLLWGLICSTGYMVYVVALISVVGASQVYAKFAKLNIWAVLWIVVWSIIFNEIATILALNLEIVNNLMPELSFARGLDLLFDLIKTEPEVKSAVISDTVFNVLMVIIAGVIMYVNSVVKSKKQMTAVQSDVTPSMQQPERKVDKDLGFEQYYKNVKAEFTSVVANFKQNKDKEQFKAKVHELSQKFFAHSSDEVKQELKVRVEKDSALEGISKEESIVYSTILKLL